MCDCVEPDPHPDLLRQTRNLPAGPVGAGDHTHTERVNITPHKICIHTRRAFLRSRVTVRCPSCSRPSTKWTSSGEPCRCFSIPGGLPPPAVRGQYCRTSVHYPSRRSLPKIPGCSQASCCILQRAEPARSSYCSEGQSSSSLSVPFAVCFRASLRRS